MIENDESLMKTNCLLFNSNQKSTQAIEIKQQVITRQRINQ